jgi:signal transduction histidine kinase/ActR/RegA family two-component response regulator
VQHIAKRSAGLLLAIVTAAVLPVAVAATVAINVLIDDQQRLIESDFRADAIAVLAAVDGELFNQLEMAESLDAFREYDTGDFAALHERFLRWLDNHPGWTGIIVVDPATMMQVISTAHPSGSPAMKVVEQESVREAVTTGKPVIGPLSAGPGGRFLVPLRVPVMRDGVARYVVSVLLSPARVTAIVNRQGTDGRITAVLDRNHTLVARTDGEQFVGQQGTVTPNGAYGQIVNGPGQDGRQYARVVVRSEATGWAVGVGATLDVLAGPLNNRIMVIALVSTVAALLSVSLALFFSRRLRRMVQAEESARRRELEEAYLLANEASDAAAAANAEKSRFLAAVSHDLRQPIQAMQNLAHLLTSRITSHDERNLARQLQSSIGASAALLNALLDISKLDAGAIRPQVLPVDLDALLAAVVNEFRQVAQDKGLRIARVPARYYVSSDMVLLGSILRNLVSNAVRYTTTGRVLIGCRRQGNRLRIEVWDTGIGIPQESQQDIFREFRQLGNAERDREKGLGLGLAIVERLARLLDHEVGLRSQPGRGTVIWVVAPLTAKPQSISLQAPVTPSRAAGKRILFIEDDAVQAHTAAMMMEDWGYQVEIASSAAQAESRVGDFIPDIIVSDYRLRGGVDGLAVIRRLRDLLAMEAPAILLTGETSFGDEVARAGVRILYKPYVPDQLEAAIYKALQATASSPLPVA